VKYLLNLLRNSIRCRINQFCNGNGIRQAGNAMLYNNADEFCNLSGSENYNKFVLDNFFAITIIRIVFELHYRSTGKRCPLSRGLIQYNRFRFSIVDFTETFF
jgi:hypothetical protein